VLGTLAQRWQLEWGPLIPRGSMSVVIRCRMPEGRAAVLKVSPDRARLASEAAALERWSTAHTPSVLAVDAGVGALLIEAIEPGTPLVESLIYPDTQTTATLLTSLHATAVPDPSYPSLAHRVAYLFDLGAKPYQRHPALLELIPLALYERGRHLATRLAGRVPPTAVLHGDLTPSNILDGGPHRGLVAIDPAPASATTSPSTPSTSCSGKPPPSTRSRPAPNSSLPLSARTRATSSTGVSRSPP
jgi:streptomycin 6-kinase